ncbi:MAG: hypothetical protein GX660_23795 [Clostridiaceae bacterium]|nr:hypothetical protein [Clostridiaceae bacterium]
MNVSREVSEDISLKGLVTYPTVLLLLLGFYAFFFLKTGSPGYEVRRSFYFLLYPLVIILSGISLRELINYIFVGKLVKFIGSSTVVLAYGTAAFLFLYLASDSMDLKLASIYPVLISISIIIYKFSGLFKGSIFIDSVIKTISYLVAGLSIRYMFVAIWTNGFWDIGLKISVGDLVLFSFWGIALMQMLSLIDLTGNEKAGRISFWLKRYQVAKFISIFIFFYLLYDFRGDVMGEYVLAGWIFIFVVLLVAFIAVILRLKKDVGTAPEERLGRHFQDISYSKIKDITNISKYINDFVEHGSRTGIVSCLYYMACKSEISISTASKMILPLLEYSDMGYPGITTRKNFKTIEERNRQNRMKILEDVINSFEYYGRGVGYLNEFGKASGTL